MHLNVPCPGCGGAFERYPNNRPVADFRCQNCREDFELKSTSARIGKSIPDGAYLTMISRLVSSTNPHLFILQYDLSDWFVNNLMVIPKYYFVPNIVKKRKALSPTARRAGWVGCNIAIGDVPHAGRIPLVVDRVARPPRQVIEIWKKTEFLRDVSSPGTKNWLLETMSCIDRIGEREFRLSDIYRFESEFRILCPENRHLREKLRQQLQVLRDRGYLSFLGKGRYRVRSLSQ